MTENEFGKICKTFGFSRLAPRFYARCIGDGVYQTICTGFRQYISPISSHYAGSNRRSYCISIGVKSLFSHWPEDIFRPGLHSGGYTPADLGTHSDTPFGGIEEQYREMIEFGFESLNRIDSQEKLLELYESVHRLASGDRIHCTSLVAPYFLVGNAKEAVFELCYEYTHFMSSFQRINRCLHQCGKTGQYYQLEEEMLSKHSFTVDLWNAWLSGDYGRISNYLQQNCCTNLNRIEKYGISICESSFSLRKIPDSFRIDM